MAIKSNEIREQLQTDWLGHQIFYYPAVESTNNLLKELAEKGEPAGTLVLADYQSQGRGRKDRLWRAPDSTSLLFSLLFRPNWPVEKANWLTMIAGMAVVQAIAKETGLITGLKWPNDIVVANDQRIKKTGGILLDSKTDKQRVSWVVVGIGINVNISSQELPETITPATSLAIEIGHFLSRQQLLITILNELEHYYKSAERGQSPQPLWNDQLVTIGRRVRVVGNGNRSAIEGTALGTDSWGRLVIRDYQGDLHTVAAGDVTLRG